MQRQMYITVHAPNHPRAGSNKQVPVHILIAERALGKFLPRSVHVHHIDEDKTNNANTNLVICQDHGYHYLLHRRRDALLACGNVNARKCTYCHQWDDPAAMSIIPAAQHKHLDRAYHLECARQYNKKLRAAKNPQELSALKKAYWARNRERERTRERKRYAQHRERRLAAQRAWRASLKARDPQKLKERDRRYGQAYRARQRAKKKQQDA